MHLLHRYNIRHTIQELYHRLNRLRTGTESIIIYGFTTDSIDNRCYFEMRSTDLIPYSRGMYSNVTEGRSCVELCFFMQEMYV